MKKLQDSNGDPIQQEIDERIKRQIIKETAIEFSKKVEALVWQDDISYLDAITILAEEGNYEPERVAKMITPYIRGKLEKESEDRSLIKKDSNRLDKLL
jgi:hypothetical protein